MRLDKVIILIALISVPLILQGCGSQDGAPKDYSVLNPQKDFTLKDQDGNIFRMKDHRGQVLILFLGYTQCPDVCPTTFSKLAKVYSLLGLASRQKILTVLVSVDPERDTPEKLKEYIGYFNINAVGLTGTKEEIDAVVDAYKASYQKVGEGSAVGYLVDHSDYLYLIDTEGTVRYLFHQDDKPEKMAKVIKRIYKP